MQENHILDDFSDRFPPYGNETDYQKLKAEFEKRFGKQDFTVWGLENYSLHNYGRLYDAIIKNQTTKPSVTRREHVLDAGLTERLQKRIAMMTKQDSSRLASDFQDVSDLQFKFRKQLFDLYSENRDDKTDEYFKELKKLEKEQKREVQQVAKSIYDEVKETLGHSQKVGTKEVENKYNFWLYKGNTGMKITVLKDGKKIMTLKCGRDIDHETSGAREKVLTILGNEDELNKKRDKEKFVISYADTAKDILRIYADTLKKVI